MKLDEITIQMIEEAKKLACARLDQEGNYAESESLAKITTQEAIYIIAEIREAIIMAVGREQAEIICSSPEMLRKLADEV